MPRKALVSVEDAVTTIELFIEHFEEGNYPNYSSDIWKQMSNSLNNKWSAVNIYINVTQNRRNIMTIACANKNIPFIPFISKNKIIMDDTTLDNSTLNNSENSFYEFEPETAGLDEFKVRITNDEWKQMQAPDVVYKDNRKYSILRQNVWTDILALAIDRQMELPCAFSFKNFKIYNNADSKHYMRIIGYCKSKKCGNKLFGYLNEDPGDNDFDIIIKTRDTWYDNHEKVERQLRGMRRQQVGQEVFNEGCVNWYKRQVRENAKVGGRIPSHIPNLNVLHCAKKEYVDCKLGIKASDGKDLINTIEEMNRSAPYYGFIHEVKRNKFYVAFSTPAQLHAYKQYCRTMKNLSSISIDGTGSIVKPLLREDGSPSGHIFLYSVIINFDKTTLSVYDMLTESQDTDIIWWWLKHWQKLGAPKPRQAVCDSSRALMNGISQAFNFQTVKTYIETCFLYATGNVEYHHRSPIYTFLRLDVAHLMIMVRKWDCFKHMRHTVVRQFYQYCFGLMIDCQTLDQFQEIFQLTCIVGVNEFQDSIIKKTGHSVLHARRRLEEYISNRKFNIDFESDLDYNEENMHEKEEEEKNSTNNSRIQNWINNLHKTAAITHQDGSEPNSFYFIDFIDRFMSLAYEFPLWTAVAIPYIAEHAQTTFIEGHFNIVKHKMLQNYPGRLRVDKFLKLILNDYSANAALLTSKLKVFNQNDGPCLSPPLKKQNTFVFRYTNNTVQQLEKESSKVLIKKDSVILNSTQDVENSVCYETDIVNANYCDNKNNICSDNYKVFITEDEQEEYFTDKITDDLLNKNKFVNDTPKNINHDNKSKIEIKESKGKYFKCNPNIHHRNTLAANIRRPWLLQNGNLVSGPACIDGLYYFCCNTCGFDSIIQILSASAMDNPKYVTFIQTSKDEVLQFVKCFVESGPSAMIYKKRIILLKHLFESNMVVNYDQCRKLTSYTIDLYECLSIIWKKCFNSEPSGWYTHQCPKCDEYTTSAIIVEVNHNIILENGFGALQKAFDKHNDWKQKSCINNCSNYCQTKLCTFNTQVFIELDVRPNIESSNGICGKLCDFPIYLDFDNHQYQLAGVIARLPGHYVSYCRRINNRWDLCNDLKSKITLITKSVKARSC